MNDELITLTEAYCNGTLDGDGLHKLQQILLGDAVARAYFRRYLGLDAALHEHGASTAGLWSQDPPRRSNRRARVVGLAGLVALCVFVTFAVALLPRSTSAEVGRLEQINGDVRVLGADGQVRAIDANLPVAPGDTVRTQGTESSTVMVYPDGTRLMLVGNTSMTCGDSRSNSLVVHHGNLSASVRPQRTGKPLVITTPSAQLQVLGTRFQIEALATRTDLSVTEGKVRLVRTSDGKTVDVVDGKHAVVTAKSNLQVQDIPGLGVTWEADFENGLPPGWDYGEFVTQGLPAGSRGGVRAVRRDDLGVEPIYNISSNEAWFPGLFAVQPTSHIHVTFKMSHPKWINILLATRTSDPHEPHYSGNYLFKDFPPTEPEKWQTVTIPLTSFERIHAGDVPLADVVPFKLSFFSDLPDRGLVVDRVWITPDGPGRVVQQTGDQR